jgi:hypothetical protein
MVAITDSSIETSMKAAALGRVQRGADRHRGGQPAHRVGQRIADAQRRAVGVAGDRHHPRRALHDLVIGRAVAQGPVCPKPEMAQ